MTDALLPLRVQPKASRDEVTGWHGDVLRLRVRAAPEDGKANAAVVALLAEALGVPKSWVSIERGHASRGKVARVQGLDLAEARRRLGI